MQRVKDEKTRKTEQEREERRGREGKKEGETNRSYVEPWMMKEYKYLPPVN